MRRIKYVFAAVAVALTVGFATTGASCDPCAGVGSHVECDAHCTGSIEECCSRVCNR